MLPLVVYLCGKERLADLDKLTLLKFPYGGLVLVSSQYSLSPQI